jgi:hypothetical protein
MNNGFEWECGDTSAVTKAVEDFVRFNVEAAWMVAFRDAGICIETKKGQCVLTISDDDALIHRSFGLEDIGMFMMYNKEEKAKGVAFLKELIALVESQEDEE